MRFPEFVDNQHIKVARMSIVRTGLLYPPGDILGTSWRLNRLQGHNNEARRIKSMKYLNGPIGNRIHHLRLLGQRVYPLCYRVTSYSPYHINFSRRILYYSRYDKYFGINSRSISTITYSKYLMLGCCVVPRFDKYLRIKFSIVSNVA